MTFLLEYHISVRHSIPASVAFLLLIAFPAAFDSTSHAQINGAPASVTSPGFGGRAINGPPASATSLGPQGYAPPSGEFFPSREFRNREFHNGEFHNGEFHNGEKHRQQRPGDHTHRGDGNSSVFYAVPIPVPYAVDLNATNARDIPNSDPIDAPT